MAKQKDTSSVKNLHILNSYNIWSISQMKQLILQANPNPTAYLNRTWKSLYIEWYLHNIGYWVTLPFIKTKWIADLNVRFKHVDLEEW